MAMARKIDLMYLQFGEAKEPDAKCGNCEHLRLIKTNRNYYKCDVYGVSSSVATDWKVGSHACGMFNRPYSDGEVRQLVCPTRKEEAQIPGQMSFDFGGEIL